MKIWQKTKKNDFDHLVMGWRIRSVGRLFSKIFSWLLGAFVIGLLTSIFFLALQAPQLSQPMARVLFFLFFFLGISSNFYRTIVNGLEYWITGDALVQVQPFCGFEKLNSLIGGKTYPFRTEYYYIPWDNIKTVKEENEKVQIVDKQSESIIDIPVDHVLKYFGYKNKKFFEQTKAHDEPVQSFSKKTRQLIIKAAKDKVI